MMIKTTIVAGAAVAATWFGAADLGAGDRSAAAQAAAPQVYCAGETPWCWCVESVQSCMPSTVGWSALTQFAR